MMSHMILARNNSPQIPAAVAPQSIFAPLPLFASVHAQASHGKSSPYHCFPTIEASMLLTSHIMSSSPRIFSSLIHTFGRRESWTRGRIVRSQLCPSHSFSLLLSTSVHSSYDLRLLSSTSSCLSLSQSRWVVTRGQHMYLLYSFYYHHRICTLQSSNVFTKLP